MVRICGTFAYRLHFRFIVIVLIFLINFLARDVGIEPTHRGFGDLTDTLSVSRILWSLPVTIRVLWFFRPVLLPS